MANFAWKPAYETGDALIDGQHKQLMDLANLLHGAIAHGLGENVIFKAFEALLLYTQDHFRDEEEFFEKIQSPLLGKHRAEHHQLAQELQDMWGEEMLGFIDGMPDALERWVENRLIPHMTIADQEAYRAGSLR